MSSLCNAATNLILPAPVAMEIGDYSWLQARGKCSHAKATWALKQTRHRFHVASQRRPKTCIGFSRWAPSEPAARIPKPERDHWAKMKSDSCAEKTVPPKLPANGIRRIENASQLSAETEQPEEKVATNQKNVDLHPAPTLHISYAPKVSAVETNYAHRGLVRSKSAREPSTWNNKYHLSAKQGYRYWWEDPDDTSAPKRISAHAKWGTPFGSHKTFFGLGFSPRK